ncbi:MAG: GNAT family N-acetyltransferase [Planctomycetota bacterium]
MKKQPQPTEIYLSDATGKDIRAVSNFLQPFVDQEFLLPLTRDELVHLLKHAFVARWRRKVVGFAAVEIYSRKLAEIQCLAVHPEFQRMGIGRRLVTACVRRAKELKVLELMAISASDGFLKECGFDYSLPKQKRALFVEPLEIELDSSED